MRVHMEYSKTTTTKTCRREREKNKIREQIEIMGEGQAALNVRSVLIILGIHISVVFNTTYNLKQISCSSRSHWREAVNFFRTAFKMAYLCQNCCLSQ